MATEKFLLLIWRGGIGTVDLLTHMMRIRNMRFTISTMHAGTWMIQSTLDSSIHIHSSSICVEFWVVKARKIAQKPTNMLGKPANINIDGFI
jgi:hypothetical protein